MAKLDDLREWLLLQIDGSEETRGDDGLISDFIRQIDALPSEIAEPRGCPTPGACSAVDELADLKQRLLPQANGRAERAEKARQMAVVERDALLEKLIVHQTTIANLHDVIDGMRNAPPSATGEPVAWCVGYDDPRAGRIHSDATMNLPQAEALAERNNLALVPLYAQAAPVEETAPVECGYDRTASLNSGRYVCLCGGACSHYDAGGRVKPWPDWALWMMFVLCLIAGFWIALFT